MDENDLFFWNSIIHNNFLFYNQIKLNFNIMKKIIFLFVLSLIFSKFSFAQLDDVLKKVTKNVANVELFEEKNITTSIDDALPVAFWLKDFDLERVPVEPETYDFNNLGPGYYRFTVQSYCLHAGTYGPTKGSGYLMAPLKGKRSDLVYNVLNRSVEHPEIAQHDIQVFLWGIVDGVKFSDYSLEFQNKIRPLVTPEEIADLTLDLKNVPLEVMPEEIRKVAKYYQDLRAKITNPNITYNEIESAAMLNGYLPADPFSKYVQKGLWSYIGNGFYMRDLPISYPESVIEIYRPLYVNSSKDAKGRLSSLENAGSKIEISYDDDPGRDVITFDGKNYPIWRFKSIKLSGSNPGEELILDNPGWAVKDNGEPLKNSGQSFSDFHLQNDPTFNEYEQRIKDVKNDAKDMDEYIKLKKSQSGQGHKGDDEWADKHINDGLKAALDPLNKKDQESWIRKHLNMVSDWWNNSSGALAGEENNDNGGKKADVSRTPAVPATNGMQRLVPSARKFGS